MKTAISLVLALLAGLVIGTWSVKADLRLARKEVDRLKQQLARRPAPRQSGLDGITSMLKIPKDTATSQESTNAPNPDAGQSSETVTLRFGNVDTNTVTRHRRRPDRETLRKQLETAANAWKVRSDIARAGVLSNTAASDDQAAQFDVTIAAMNLRLSNSVRTWVDYVKEQQDVTPETGLRIMNDLSSSLVYAYNDLDRALPPDWRDKAGPKFQVFDFVNPEVIMPLTEVEDVFRRTDDAVTGSNAVGHRAP
jgi:hypothetical protein